MSTAMKWTTIVLTFAFAFSMMPGGAGVAFAADLCVHPIGDGGCYTSIQAAIDVANPGDTVLVAAGYYEENLASWKDMEITKSLTLKGEGSGQTIIGLSEGKTNGVEIRGSDLDVHIEGITFTKRTGNDYASNFALRVAETTSTFTNFSLKDVIVEYALAPNLHLGAAGTFENVVIVDSIIRYAGSYGFFAQGTIANMSVTNSDFNHNGQVDTSLGKGIEFANGPFTNVHIDGGDFSNNKRNGLNLNNISNSSFKNLTANNNGAAGSGHGINFVQYSGGSSSNILFENVTANENIQDGIQLGSEPGESISDISIIGGEFHSNPRAGIFRWGGFGGTTSNITIDGATLSGGSNGSIHLNSTASNYMSNITVKNTTIGAGPANGIVVLWADGILFENNTVSGRTANGLAVVNGLNVVISGNTSQNNTVAGAVIANVDTATFSGNTFDNNPGNSPNFGNLTIRENSHNVTIENNILTGSTYGVWVHGDTSQVTVNFNNITDNTTALDNTSLNTVNATCNWWGTVDKTEVDALVSGDVTYVPFLLSDDLENGFCIGGLPPTEIEVTIGGILRGEYELLPVESAQTSYAGVNTGPALVEGTTNILSSQRVLYDGVSYSEMMGFPDSKVTNAYIFPWYNNVAMNSQLRVSNLGAVDTTIEVYLGTDPTPIDTLTLEPGEASRSNYPGRNSGPLRVESSATNILATIRVLYAGNSYSELMGYPVNQLTNEYLFPYYNNVAMSSQLRVSNLGDVYTTINVYLGDSATPIDTFSLEPGESARKNYPGRNDGPLRVVSSDTDIISTIRVLYAGNSYSELMGFPANQLAQEYWYPVYDSASLNSQLRVSNVGAGPTTITVYFGDDPTPIDTYTLEPGEAARSNYAGLNGGPLRVVSSAQPIMSTVRTLYGGGSYYEMTGLPNTWLSTQYWSPWYNNVAMNSELRIAVPLP